MKKVPKVEEYKATPSNSLLNKVDDEAVCKGAWNAVVVRGTREELPVQRKWKISSWV